MAKSTHLDQVLRLISATTGSAKANGERRVQEIELAVTMLLEWLQYLEKSERTGCCDQMLSGIRSAVIEAAGGLALGLARLSIFAMRGQIDLAFSWLFFKDHPVEWAYFLETGEEFKLKGDLFSYLETYNKKFASRVALLEKYKTRKVSDPFRVLSAHIHGQSAMVMPKFTKLDGMVYSDKLCVEAVLLQKAVVEYISDIFVAHFGDKWASLPVSIVSAVKSRVPAAKQPILFT